MELTFDLTQSVEGALVFDLTGTSSGWQGLRLSMTVRAPGNVVSTGSTLVLTGTAQGLVFDDVGQPAIAVDQEERGQCLALGTGIGFNADFSLRQNEPLAENIMQWAKVRVSLVIYLPVIIKSCVARCPWALCWYIGTGWRPGLQNIMLDILTNFVISAIIFIC